MNTQRPIIHREIDFPFDEIKQESGDYFDSIQQTMSAGYSESQIWSVILDESDDPKIYSIFTYGPPHHFVNLLGYVATQERHDFNTYYEEVIYRADGDFMEDDDE